MIEQATSLVSTNLGHSHVMGECLVCFCAYSCWWRFIYYMINHYHIIILLRNYRDKVKDKFNNYKMTIKYFHSLL